MISPHRFEWNSMSTVDFDVFTQFSLDGDDGEMDTFLTRSGIVSETYNGARKHCTNYKWDQQMSPTITLIKKDFGDFDVDENKRLLRWLTGKQTPGFLTIYNDDSNVVHYEICGNFVEVKQFKMGNSRVVGYVCKFEALTPYAFSPLYTLTTSNNSITINIDTDEPEAPIYPRITITMKSNGNVTLTNTYAVDGVTHVATSEVADNKGGEVITLDGANRIVSSTHQRIFGNNFDWNWLPLYDGTNTITISGDCTVKFEYREIRKIGEI